MSLCNDGRGGVDTPFYPVVDHLSGGGVFFHRENILQHEIIRSVNQEQAVHSHRCSMQNRRHVRYRFPVWLSP
jgi:hypothetical protein